MRCLKGFRVILATGGLVFLLVASGRLVAQENDETTAPSTRVVKPQDTPANSDDPLAGVPREFTWPLSPKAPTAPAAGPDYIIGAEDVLKIEVLNLPELTSTVRVSNDGKIELPLLGEVPASGQSVQQLRRGLESKWGESYLESPQVSVFIKEFRAQPVSVIGAVEKPGLFYVTGRRTLIEMLSEAGGLGRRPSAPAGRTVLVTRRGGFGQLQPVKGMRFVAPEKIEIELHPLLYSHEDALNVEIKPLDTISVSKAEVVYVVGEVRKPGGFVLEDRESLTILQALAMAEGLNSTSAKHAARIIRKSEDGSMVEIPVNLGKVFKGKSPDMELIANDILFVPDSTGKMAAKRGAEAAVQTISGVLIWRQARTN